MARPADGSTDIAFDATIRAAAPHQIERLEQREKLAFAIEKVDLQRKVRVKRMANLVLFVLDASWSLDAKRMAATKGAIFSLLTDAYQRRDRVGLIVFRDREATLVLPPTNSIELAERALPGVQLGGTTPLSAGLVMAARVLRHERSSHPDVEPLLVVLTDACATRAMGTMAPQQEAYLAADALAEAKIRTLVINLEQPMYDRGLASELAKHLHGACRHIAELTADELCRTVQQDMRVV